MIVFVFQVEVKNLQMLCKKKGASEKEVKECAPTGGMLNFCTAVLSFLFTLSYHFDSCLFHITILLQCCIYVNLLKRAPRKIGFTNWVTLVT